MGRDRRRRRRRHGAAGDDRISGLPNDLLGCILLRVGSTRAAARTSVLSQRWRRVWTHLPDLRLGTCDADYHPGATRLDTVDAALHALDATTAPAVRRLDVAMHCHGLSVHARRVAPWLRFASQRRVEELSIEVPSQTRFVLAGSRDHTKEQEDLELPVPVWGEATNIALTLDQRWRLRLPPAGLFVALTDLYICLATMEASELGHLVSSQCPRLRNLYLSVLLADVSDLSIRSDSLQSLDLCVKDARRFEVIAPKLEVLSMTDAIEARIYAPKLEEVTWDGDIAYDPSRHCFVDAGRHLRLLDLGTKGVVASLLQRFDKADVLKLNVNLNNTGSLGYIRFLNETIKLPKCETLSLRVTLGDYYHNLASIILHLLRTCNSIRKISVIVDSGHPMRRYSCQLSCHCRLPESRKANGITLDALEKVKITLIRSSCEEVVEFVEQLAKCHAPSLKKLVINCEWWNDSPTKEIQEKVCRMFNPDVDVKFNVS